MLKSRFWKVVPLLLLIYITAGDMFLPPSMGNYSRLARNRINNYLLSVFPKTDIENPYGKNDKAIEDAEKGKFN
jgi:hypothetical protein